MWSGSNFRSHMWKDQGPVVQKFISLVKWLATLIFFLLYPENVVFNSVSLDETESNITTTTTDNYEHFEISITTMQIWFVCIWQKSLNRDYANHALNNWVQVVIFSTTSVFSGTPVFSYTNDTLASSSEPTTKIYLGKNNLFLYRC